MLITLMCLRQLQMKPVNHNAMVPKRAPREAEDQAHMSGYFQKSKDCRRPSFTHCPSSPSLFKNKTKTKKHSRGWKDGSAVKRTGCSCRGTRFNFQNAWQLALTGNATPGGSETHFWSAQAKTPIPIKTHSKLKMNKHSPVPDALLDARSHRAFLS